MRKLRNTLYITTPDAYLARENDSLLVCREGAPAVRFPALNLEGVVQFSYPGASPAALELCAQKGITVSFCDPSGRFLARMEGPVSGSILLRRQQYRWCDNASGVAAAQHMITAKIMNCRTVLQRGLRDHGGGQNQALTTAIASLRALALDTQTLTTLDDIRGTEGQAARIYFEALDALILEDKSRFFLHGRNRRPPLDRVNCLLSYFYTLLTHECRAACETVGLDPSAGFLHRDRPGRPSMALDLMEELRPVVADRMVLSLINRMQIQAQDFEVEPNGAVLLSPKAKRTLLDSWQKRKQEVITHPFLQEKVEFGLLPYVQAMLLSRHIRGDLDEYPAFIWR